MEALSQVFSCEFREIFKNNFFAEHLWITVYMEMNFISCLSIICSWLFRFHLQLH